MYICIHFANNNALFLLPLKKDEWSNENEESNDAKLNINIKIESTIKDECESEEDYEDDFVNVKLEDSFKQDVSDVRVNTTKSMKRTASESDIKYENPEHTPQKRRYFHEEEPQQRPCIKKKYVELNY